MNAKWLRREGLESEEIEGMNEVVYFDPADGSSFSLNTTAAAILDLCDGEHSAEAIADVICSSLAADRREVLAHVHQTLEELADYGLIRPV